MVAKGRENPGGQDVEFSIRMEAFAEFLAEKGLKLTRQRSAVLEEVLNGGGHFDAEDMVARLKGGTTQVSRATVYRTLELLRECNLVDKLDLGESRSYYEQMEPGAHHDHLICTRCGNVLEFHNEKLEALQTEICRKFDFEEAHHSLRIFGLCGKCRGKGQAHRG